MDLEWLWDLSSKELTILAVLSYFNICTYSYMLVFACRNAWIYLHKQRRRENPYLIAFYIFAIIIALCRISYFVFGLLAYYYSNIKFV